MICECGQPLQPYAVTVDEEQYVEDLCPNCAFPEPLKLFDASANPDLVEFAGSTSSAIINFRSGDTLALNLTPTITPTMIDDTMAKLKSLGRTGKTLFTSPGTLKKLLKEFSPANPIYPGLLGVGGNQLTIHVGGHALDVRTTSALKDDEAAIICDADIWHPVELGLKRRGII